MISVEMNASKGCSAISWHVNTMAYQLRVYPRLIRLIKDNRAITPANEAPGLASFIVVSWQGLVHSLDRVLPEYLPL